MNNIDVKNLSYTELLELNKTINEFIDFLEKEKETVKNEQWNRN